MKNYDYWKKFIRTGKIDDYLNYIACTREEESEELSQVVPIGKEGDICAGINYCDGDGSVGQTGW
ncbi:MAG: hypothetical protein GX306_00495 [Clostridiales bacterium]|jgi:hypothetical protein|nr:hypothetical protein [Clostridiales bacterium]